MFRARAGPFDEGRGREKAVLLGVRASKYKHISRTQPGTSLGLSFLFCQLRREGVDSITACLPGSSDICEAKGSFKYHLSPAQVSARAFIFNMAS